MKKIVIAIFMLIFICCCGFSVNAQTFEFNINDDTDLFTQMYEDYNLDELYENSPDDVKDIVDDFEISPSDPFSYQKIFSKEGFEYLKEYVLSNLAYPLKYLSIMLISIIVCAICGTFTDNSLQINHSVNLVCVLAVTSVLIYPISSIITEVVSTVNTVTVFMNVFIPVFAGILIACLKSGTSAAYSSVMFFTCEAISYCCNTIVLPFSNCFMALSVASGISETSRLNGIIKLLKKAAFILLTAAMTVFLAVLSMQSFVTNTADNAASKTAKFLISSFIPIVGSSVSEALSSLKGCISILKSSAGIYAVIAILIMLLPLILKIVVFKLLLVFCSDISEVFFVGSIKNITDALNSALSIVLSVAICVLIMFIFSVTILSIAGGAV
ncbi:MAG: hypothetical protein ACI39F_02285 [Acutalibacteraceae bacterium]